MDGTLARVRNTQVEALLLNWNLQFELVDVGLDQIRTDPTQQVRDSDHIANPEIVSEYLVQHENGAQFPPIVLRKPGIMLDGNTRAAMARKAGLTSFPAYLVDVPSGDLARALGAQLNQMGGVRLTPAEAQKAALDMMENLRFTDAQIGAAVGRSGQQVRQWRQQVEARHHAERVKVDIDAVPPSQHKVLARIKQDEPFKQAVDLASTRKVPFGELSRIVKEIENATSEADAVAVIDRARTDLRPVGPSGKALAVNLKAKRMRMVLPQVLNLAPPLDVYDAARAEDDRRIWQQVRGVCDAMLAMYDEQQAAVLPGFELPSAEDAVTDAADDAPHSADDATKTHGVA